MALNTVSSDRLATNVKTSNLGTELKKKVGQNKNIIINGAMNVAQRGTSSTGLGASAGYFTLDRYRTTFNATAGRVTMEQVADVHDGFANALKFSCTTADTSVAAGEYFMLQQKIEGQDLQQLKKGSSDAEEFTVSFYVKGNASATYVVEMFDLDNNRQISKTFSVTTNWTRVELTFPGDTTGAFDDDNAASLQLAIWLHAGSTYSSGTLNSSAFAANTNANRAVGISSIFDSTARTFFITGLQLEVGSVATDFEHRSFAQELALCQRYFEKSFAYSYAPVQNESVSVGYYFMKSEGSQLRSNNIFFKVPKRGNPTMTYFNPYAANANARLPFSSTDLAGIATNTAGENWFSFHSSDNSPSPTLVHLQWTANAEL